MKNKKSKTVTLTALVAALVLSLTPVLAACEENTQKSGGSPVLSGSDTGSYVETSDSSTGGADEGSVSSDEDTGDDGNNSSDSSDPDFSLCYGYGFKNGANGAVFDIGATEEDLRNILFIFYTDEDEVDHEITDYTIEGFDGSKSFNDVVEIVIDEDHDIGINVLVYDHANAREESVEVDDPYIWLGATKTEAEECLGADVTSTDGNITWSEYQGGFIIKSVDNEVIGGDFVFDKVGDHSLTLTREKTGESYECSAYVYDPDNLIVIGIDCDESVYVYAGATEEDIRKNLSVYLVYDNRSGEEIFDYEIVGGYTDGMEKITVRYGEYTREAKVVIWEDPSYDEPTAPGKFDFSMLIKMLRFVEHDEDNLIVVAVQSIPALIEVIVNNGELLSSLVDFYSEDGKYIARIAVNTADDKDLLAALNLFVGIPTEEGYIDIDENLLTSIVYLMSGTESFDLNAVFGNVPDFDFSKMISDLYLEVGVSFKGGFEVFVRLVGGDGKEYYSGSFGPDSIINAVLSLLHVDLPDGEAPQTE